MKPLLSYITPRNVASIILVLFCIQYIPLESRAGVSYIKLTLSILCPFFLITFSPKITKAFFWCVIYYCFVLSAAILHPETLRWSTILFLCSFLVTYITFYNLVVIERVFNFDFFLNLLKYLLLAYIITLVIQQFFIIIGIKTVPIINLTQSLNRNIGANSLSYEPSSAARIMAILYLGIIRMLEIQQHTHISISQLYKKVKWPTIGFIWSMLTMGSATAFIALGILLLHFIKRKYVFTIIPIFIILYCIAPNIDNNSVQRAYNMFNAVLTGSQEIVIETDVSAATRVAPLMNLFTKLDLTDLKTWFGHGVDYTINLGDYKAYMKDGIIGGVLDYGFLSFIIMQILIFSCAISRIFSIETLLWIILFGFSFSNVPYTWGAIMVFTTIRYFTYNYDNLKSNGYIKLD